MLKFVAPFGVCPRVYKTFKEKKLLFCETAARIQPPGCALPTGGARSGSDQQDRPVSFPVQPPRSEGYL